MHRESITYLGRQVITVVHDLMIVLFSDLELHHVMTINHVTITGTEQEVNTEPHRVL